MVLHYIENGTYQTIKWNWTKTLTLNYDHLEFYYKTIVRSFDIIVQCIHSYSAMFDSLNTISKWPDDVLEFHGISNNIVRLITKDSHVPFNERYVRFIDSVLTNPPITFELPKLHIIKIMSHFTFMQRNILRAMHTSFCCDMEIFKSECGF